ncbi:DUF4189 domain-containing protein [Pseudolabrys taiwanensis]|uniref:DUF4189 domain-containing protein n=2 Tax=Pseudolabrys taiwanensis TaxID=331696 RepID=A0A346A442_9HYPH|nr:DUF4189 domain-containing protein [Pseudolabrys taiwanensis]
MRALVAAALLLGSAAVMLATMNTARAAGALAIGACGAYGDAFDFRSVDEARQNALSKCRGDNCRVVTTVRHGCAAFAVDFSNPCGGNGWGKGPRLGRTQNEALKACYTDGGKECVIRSFFCDVKG